MQIEQLGPYRIGRKLGKGGMGSVYDAVDEKSGQRVAVKALTPALAMAEGFRERFEGEIESLKKLQHEGIVRLLGYGEHEGILFYSMELVEGPSLEQEINRGRLFDWNETLTLAVQVCRALKHAHDHGVVHRDIKPANLLLTPDGRVKIADFGIARLFGSTQLTTAGGVLGTADYMSPEQADGRAITERCDQYSLGCVMYALLAGRPPFRAKTMPEMLQLQRFAQPEPVRRYAPQTPEELDRLIKQLLSKEPAERFPNVLVLGRHMEAMQRALSRPTKPAPKADRDLNPTGDTQLDSTAVFNADATLAPEDLSITPSETTDSGVYNAPTLTDPAQLELEPAPARQTATATAPRPAEKPRTSRFTTVEEAQRLQQEQASQRWLLAAQLVGLVAALAGMAWLGWWMTRPPTADALYAQIAEVADDDDRANLDDVEREITKFLELYSDDPRADKVDGLREEINLQRQERRVRKGLPPGGAESHPITAVFAEAVRRRQSDPAAAAAMLESLLALYPLDGPGATELSDDERTNLRLAARELEMLRAELNKRAEELPQLQKRLAAAKAIEEAQPVQAAAMYSALVNLYGGQAWAGEVVDAARERLQVLAER
jgi:eukaryotic-like serine/threonine-protein kinase